MKKSREFSSFRDPSGYIYYENNKTVIIFEANHACGDYVLAVME